MTNPPSTYSDRCLRDVRFWQATVLATIVAIACLTASVTAEPPPSTEVDTLVSDLLDTRAKNLKPAEKKARYEGLVASSVEELFPARVAKRVTVTKRDIDLVELQRVHRLEMERTDKQLGASPKSSASTSVAEKPGIAWLLGLALETGAITEKEDKTGVTLSTSPYAFLTLGVDDTPDIYAKYDWLRRLGISATFPLESSGDAKDRNFDPSGVTELSAKYVLYGDRSPRSARFHERWEHDVKPLVEKRLSADTDLMQKVLKLPTLLVLADETRQEMTARVLKQLTTEPEPADLATKLKQEIEATLDEAAKKLDPESLTEADKLAIRAAAEQVVATRKSLGEEEEIIKRLIEELERSPEVTAAYTYHRKDDDSDYSEVKLLAEYNTQLLTLVANASVSFNHDSSPVPTQANTDTTLPTTTAERRDTLRDYSISVSLEKKVPNFLRFRVNAGGKNEIALSLSGMLQHLEDQDDELGVAQARASVPLATGVDLGISVTYATRSEYIDEDEVRGNFGISVDTDKLYSLAQLIQQ